MLGSGVYAPCFEDPRCFCGRVGGSVLSLKTEAMVGQYCCIKSCRSRSHERSGRKLDKGIRFFTFPKWRRHEGKKIAEVTRRRRLAWVAAVRREDITFDNISVAMKVCSLHFHSGKPAYEMLESDPDWVPSLHIGESGENGRQAERLWLSAHSDTSQKQRWTTKRRHADVLKPTQRESEAATGAGRPAALPWSKVKSLLQSVMQDKTNDNPQPEDERRSRPGAAEETDHSFRDFVRGSLQASLEASSLSRAYTQRPSSVSVELSFKLPPLEKENLTCGGSSPPSSSCLNCVQLQRRIAELEEKLLCLTGGQEAPIQPDQVLQSPEPVHTEEEDTRWMEPLSPQESLNEDDPAMDLAEDAPPASPGVCQKSMSKPRPTPCFNQDWLRKFWFLRYSPSHNEMWCHVCRLLANKSHHNLALIKGSKVFKVHSIKVHRDSLCHKACVKRYMMYISELQP
uniref:THAP-type domain-containing protein n=1 Tax=Monopterus albus TaxID=43700 RepID=A0A3Q3JHZ5_MONAL|nr:uncharacterized protein LOC109969152 isoform X1 [Monopterus albus]